MARYGSGVKYGDGTLYGTSPTTTDLLWTFIVDWDADGYFSGENEVGYMVDLSISRGRDIFVNQDGGFERYRSGKATIILDNDDGRYSPFNVSSPLYPHVTPGKSVRLAVKEGSEGVNHPLLYGRIADIQPYVSGNRKMVKIDIVDGQEFLSGRTVRIGLRSDGFTTVSTGSMVDLILERADWPAEWPRTFDASDDDTKTLPYVWFWLKDALQSIRDMENAEIGTFLHTRDGQARFFEREFSHDRIVEFDESELLRDITIPQPWETLRNDIQVGVHAIKQHAVNTTLWEAGGDGDQAIPIGAEDSVTFDAEFRYFNYVVSPEAAPALSVEIRDAATGGSELDSAIQIGEFGDGGQIIIQNTSATPGYIRAASLAGNAIFARYNSWLTARDPASAGIYGNRTLIVDSRFQQSSNDAQEIADFLLANLKDPRPYPTIKIENRPDRQFGLDLYADYILLTAPTLGIDRLFRIGKIEHRWTNATGLFVATSLKLEPDIRPDAPSNIEYDLDYEFDEDGDVAAFGCGAGGDWCVTDWEWEELTELLICYVGSDRVRPIKTKDFSYNVGSGDFILVGYRWSFGSAVAGTYLQVKATYSDGTTTSSNIAINGTATLQEHLHGLTSGKTLTNITITKLGNNPGVGYFRVEYVNVETNYPLGGATYSNTFDSEDEFDCGQAAGASELTWCLAAWQEDLDNERLICDLRSSVLHEAYLTGLSISVTTGTKLWIMLRNTIQQTVTSPLQIVIDYATAATTFVPIPLTAGPEYQLFEYEIPEVGDTINALTLQKLATPTYDGDVYIDSIKIGRLT